MYETINEASQEQQLEASTSDVAEDCAVIEAEPEAQRGEIYPPDERAETEAQVAKYASSPKPRTSIVREALSYAERGWRVLALHSIDDYGSCTCYDPLCKKSIAKHPVGSWFPNGFKDATTDPSVIKNAFWGSHVNIGIATGGESGVVVLDVDGEEGERSLKELEHKHGPLPDTVRSKTSRGWHYYFKHPGVEVGSGANFLPGLDWRGDDGYVVAPPSKHASGKRYEWIVPPEHELAQLPDWLLEFIAEDTEGTREVPWEGIAASVSVPSLDVKDWAKQLIIDGPRDGEYPSRSEAVFAVVCELIRVGCSDNTIRDIMLDPANKISEKPIAQGRKWVDSEIARARKKTLKPEATIQPHTTSDKSEFVCLANVELEEVEWLWYPYIPLGKLTSIEGDPGTGKSWLTMALAAEISRGGKLRGQALGDPRRALIMTAEDGLGDTVRPRLDALGGNARNVFAFEGVWTMDEKGVAELDRYICELRPTLVIIDPLVAFMGGNVDLFKANQVREVMARLAGLASRHQCAVVPIRHLTKDGRQKAIYRGQGSIDVTAACRSVLMVGKHPNDETRRVIAHAKCNLSQPGSSLGFSIVDGRFEWGDEVAITAEQLNGAYTGGGESRPAELAEQFIEDILANGPVKSTEVFEEAERAGLKKRTMMRAKEALNVPSKKIGSEWYWEACQT